LKGEIVLDLIYKEIEFESVFKCEGKKTNYKKGGMWIRAALF
jgi:hypothetical protein